MVVLHKVYLKRGILRTNVSLLPPDLKEYLLVSAYVSIAESGHMVHVFSSICNGVYTETFRILLAS
jgi:hypothetical protein